MWIREPSKEARSMLGRFWHMPHSLQNVGVLENAADVLKPKGAVLVHSNWKAIRDQTPEGVKHTMEGTRSLLLGLVMQGMRHIPEEFGTFHDAQRRSRRSPLLRGSEGTELSVLQRTRIRWVQS